MRAMRWLTCEHAMLPAIKEAGAIATLVPFLSRERLLEMQAQAQAQLPQQQHSPATGPQQGLLLALQVQVEALHALHNICKLNKVCDMSVSMKLCVVINCCFIWQTGPLQLPVVGCLPVIS